MALTKIRPLFGQSDNLAAGGKLGAFYFADTFADIPVTGMNIGDRFWCDGDSMEYTALSATAVVATGPRDLWTPRDNVLLAANFDPAMAQVLPGAFTSGTEQWVKIPIPRSISVTNIIVVVGTAGVGLTAAQNLAGLYSISGTTATLVGTGVGDQSGVWNSIGIKTMALTGGPFVVTGPYCYVNLLSNYATSPPIFRAIQNGNQMANVGMAAANGFRFGSGSAGQTTLTASRTFAGIGNAGTAAWVGLS